MIFVDVILPVILIFLSGFFVQKKFKVSIIPISTISIYILLPALVFDTFYSTPIDMKLLYIVIANLLIFFAIVILIVALSRIRKQDTDQESAMVLTSAFANSGNYGVPVILFAFGEEGMNYAITIMVFHSIIMSIFGVYFAARGQAGIHLAIKTVLKQPANYAIILAILFQQLEELIDLGNLPCNEPEPSSNKGEINDYPIEKWLRNSHSQLPFETRVLLASSIK